MEISKLKTLATPDFNDVLPILDINGGVSGKPILRKVTLSSLLALSVGNGNNDNGFQVPTIIKTVAENSDYFIGIDNTETPYKISKSSLLTGVGNSGGSSNNNGNYPTRFTHWHDESTVVRGAAVATDIATAYYYYTAFYQPSNALNDSFKFDIFVDTGNYEFAFLTRFAPNLGIASLALNGNTIHNDLDFYGGGSMGVIKRNVTIVNPGINTIAITTVGKNASSTGYYILLTKVWGKMI